MLKMFSVYEIFFDDEHRNKEVEKLGMVSSFMIAWLGRIINLNIQESLSSQWSMTWMKSSLRQA